MRLKSAFFRMAMVAVVGVLVASAPVQAQTVNFNSLGYAGDCQANPSLWDGSGNEILAHEGMVFAGLFALDVAHYQSSCWNMYNEGSPQNGYVTAAGAPLAPVVGLLRWPGMIQREGGELFNLNTLQVGAGWTDVTLMFSGYRGWKDDAPAAELYQEFNITPFGLTTLDFSGWTGLRYFELSAVYGTNDAHNISERTKLPVYQTSFVAGITTSDFQLPAVVPEPASIALLGVGLAGLGLIARRRRSVR